MEFMVSIHLSRVAGWSIRPVDSPDSSRGHRAIFRGWVECGERTDYAWVDIHPPFEPSESGTPESLSMVLIGPRHEGVFLNEERSEWPLHVYVMTAPLELSDAPSVPSDALKIQIWAVLTGKLRANS